MNEIPKAHFIENVDAYFKRYYKSMVDKSGKGTTKCAHDGLIRFDDMINRYRLLKVSLAQKVIFDSLLNCRHLAF